MISRKELMFFLSVVIEIGLLTILSSWLFHTTPAQIVMAASLYVVTRYYIRRTV